uniref:Uncharacterized protein n=1 Tax=Glossina brevipalpis TaxID=37001 RepID=A0A1A9X3J9_9MUSC
MCLSYCQTKIETKSYRFAEILDKIRFLAKRISYQKITAFKMETNSVSPLPPPDAPLAMMENEKTPPVTPSVTDMPPPPDEK